MFLYKHINLLKTCFFSVCIVLYEFCTDSEVPARSWNAILSVFFFFPSVLFREQLYTHVMNICLLIWVGELVMVESVVRLASRGSGVGELVMVESIARLASHGGGVGGLGGGVMRGDSG